MNYFNECATIDQAKTLFNKLVFKLHPDTSGYDSQTDFIRMYNEFKGLKLKDFGGKETTANVDELYNLIKLFDGLENIIISFVGSFIWLEGDTYNNKDKIKAISIDGMNPPRYASKKKAWYFSPMDYKKKGKKSLGLNEIKELYGTKQFKAKGQYKLS